MAVDEHSDVMVVGAGLAGIVSALECLRQGLSVTLVERDPPDRLGGLAWWAFGGMALVGTPEQARLGVVDTPEIALRDWLRFGELGEGDAWPRQWAQFYVQHSRTQVYDWLRGHGVRFMPAVNWVERGTWGEGNSLPRYHVVWGTARELTRRLLEAMQQASTRARLQVLSRHRVTALASSAGHVNTAVVVDEDTGRQRHLHASAIVLAMGGINGTHEQTIANWPKAQALPRSMLNGAHPNSDGKLHHWLQNQMGAQITHAGEMWNYAAGIPHPSPQFPGHGLSTIPCKSALWLDHTGRRIGPAPLVTGFDTHALCTRVAELDRPYTWHLLNWRIALKEFAISGAEHNPHIRDKQWLGFAAEMLFGNRRLVRQMQRESKCFLVDDTLSGLAAKMNALSGTQDIHVDTLQSSADAFDANFAKGQSLHNDDQIRRILHARQWPADRLRTCKPAPLQAKRSGPYIAIQMQLITRKSLGGLATDLQSRVLDADSQPIPGLYCVGEAAGFGGGGVHGKRSLEGTFLPACILTAKAAAQDIAKGRVL